MALLKLDVEGFEKFVIEGGQETFKKVGCVYFEVSEHNFRDFGYQTKDVLIAFENLGFSLFKIVEPGQLLVIDSQYTSQLAEHYYENLFAIRNIKDFIERTAWTIKLCEQAF